MLPTSRPSASVVVGYPVRFSGTPTYNQLEAAGDVVRRSTRDALALRGGNATYLDLADLDGPADTSTVYLGLTVSEAHGSPSVEVFSLSSVDRAFARLGRLQAAAQAAREALRAHDPGLQIGGEPVVAFLFNTGDSQADATMYLGGEGQLDERGGQWHVSLSGHPRHQEQLQAQLNRLFPISGDPLYAHEDLVAWLHSQKKPYSYNAHGSLDTGSAGFLYGKHVATLLEGATERQYSREAFEAVGARTRAQKGPRVLLVIRSVYY